MPKLTKKLKLAFPLDDAEAAALRSCALTVWNYIGSDVMQMVNEEGKDSIPRSHVIELVCDAGRLEDEIRRHYKSGRTNDLVPPQLVAALKNYDFLKAFLQDEAFNYQRYS